MVLTGEQIRAARAILRWKAVELAEKAGVGLSTVQRAEQADGPAAMMRANMSVPDPAEKGTTKVIGR